ncbi:MAG: methionine--tRNA ligase [Chloroflexi bacterium]|nr:methionine--tRNA ligase [Chloroflexota bacterium]
MSEYVLAGVAWPYANALIHAGNLVGAYLPADIFSRYQRLRGRHMLMVSGSDAHGTPITVRADKEGVPPEVIYRRYHRSFLELFQKFGLAYDLFTSTHTENHFRVSQSIFLALYENGYLFTQKAKQWYSPTLGRFLPDRYVEGTCYICGYEHARSDQCDRCGNLLDPTKLINPRSKLDGSTPELRDTEHFYLDLPKLEPELLDFLRRNQERWRPPVVRQSISFIQTEGLKPRPISRDLDWGIPIPLPGWEHKVLYVWFEAVIGYLSAAVEWSTLTGQPDAWQHWWFNPEARTYYFIGKDNIPFHTLMWPAELIGSGTAFERIFLGQDRGHRLVLPYDVPANQFLNLEGCKFSGSRNWALWGLDLLERYDPDPLRYYLTAIMPETKDTDWYWEDFLRRNNDELVATWGNLAHRVLSFAYKHWGHVPEPGPLADLDIALLEEIERGFQTVGDHLEHVRLRAGLQEAMRLAAQVNKYLERRAPWQRIKEDRQDAGTIIYTALRAIDNLKTLFAPYLPFTSERLHQYLGYEAPIFGRQYTETVEDALGTHEVLRYDPSPATGRWEPSALPPGQALRKPKPLFRKLDPKIIEEEKARLGEPPEDCVGKS